MTKLIDLFLQLLIENVARKVDLHKQSVRHKTQVSLQSMTIIWNIFLCSICTKIQGTTVHSVFQQWIEWTSIINENQCQWHHTFLFFYFIHRRVTTCAWKEIYWMTHQTQNRGRLAAVLEQKAAVDHLAPGCWCHCRNTEPPSCH